MSNSTAGGTHAHRRKAKQVKTSWMNRISGGSHSLADLIEASQGTSDEAKYAASILLVDLLEQVHPSLNRGQIISELGTLPIKLPADPARFSIRSIRSRPEVVEQVEAMMKSSAMTKSVRARVNVPADWPWGTKLSTLIKLNGGEMPQGLEWLETGQDEIDPGDLILAADDPLGSVGRDVHADEGAQTVPASAPTPAAPAESPESGSAPEAPPEPASGAPAESEADADFDPMAEIESALGLDSNSNDEPEDDSEVDLFEEILDEIVKDQAS